jgi:hypothetical protein
VVHVSLHCLNNVTGVDFVHVSLLLIGQQGLGHFQVSALASHWLEDCANLTPTHKRKTTNTAPTFLNAIQAASQSTFIYAQLYSPCD